MNAKLLLKALLSFVLASHITGCAKDDPSGNGEENTIDTIAKESLLVNFSYYYYWNNEVNARNASIDPHGLEVEDYFDKLLYSGDRWSWMCDADDYISSQTGVYNDSWGVSFGQTAEDDGDYSVKVKYIYPGSPLCQFGVSRGARLDAIDGTSLTPFTKEKKDFFSNSIESKGTLDFQFHLADGRDVSFKASKSSSLSTSPVLTHCVFGPDDFDGLEDKVGYLMYLGFRANFNEQLSNALAGIRESGAKKLILDLRYNPGGDFDSIAKLISYIAPRESFGKDYLTVHHNADIAEGLDKSYTVMEEKDNLDLEDLYIIIGNGSASASEVVVNALRPFYKERLHLVGKTSYGKPNGMYTMLFPGSEDYFEEYTNGDFSHLIYAFMPICFYNVNGEGEAIPDSGFVPDISYMDDLYHDFGVDELNIKACLTHIVTGNFPEPSGPLHTTKSSRGGVLLENEWDKANYGTISIPLFQ